ncbi:hypothetical protein OHB54_00825 [Streptomyces sp. NBC_01007]|nr:hypothetical protein OHB54_00825 [Streptomyces sp. NBC_01007]
MPDSGVRRVVLPSDFSDFAAEEFGTVSEMGEDPAGTGWVARSLSVTVAVSALAQACLGAAFGVRGSPSLLRGFIARVWPATGFSEAGTFGRLLAAALSATVACSNVQTIMVETVNAILRRIRLRAFAAMPVRVTVPVSCRACRTDPARAEIPAEEQRPC